MNARHVGRPSDTDQPLPNIREFILERNPMNARRVGRPLDTVLPLQNIREFILERSPVNVRSVPAFSVDEQLNLRSENF
jgi:hypothetical protein